MKRSNSNVLNRKTIIMSLKELREALHKPHLESPVKPDPPVRHNPHSFLKLPEKYEILDTFFNGLDSSIRLLQLRRSTTTFGNIVPRVEDLTDRRFTYRHLAQLKFILPEAIVIRKVIVRDERTSCMKPDLHITMNVNSIEENGKGKPVDGSGLLRKIFRDRLVEFVNTHPEGDEVPAESLPRPFDEARQHMPNNQQEVPGAHVTQRRLNVTTSVPQATMPVMPTIKLASNSETCSSAALSPLKYPTPLSTKTVFETPTKDIKSVNNEAATQGTPAHLVSTPAKLMSATPSLQPPKRCYMTPDEESFRAPEKLARRSSRIRSLKFDMKVGEDLHNERSTIGADILDVLPQDLLESIREKEREVMMENDPAISQAKWRQKMIAKLPKFFDMVYFLFQSIKRSVITKEELVYKILSTNLDSIDKREVEDHLALLQEIVPEWIYEKSASSGDLLLCINKIQCPQSIRSQIAEAT